jgi:hypothetical protein
VAPLLAALPPPVPALAPPCPAPPVVPALPPPLPPAPAPALLPLEPQPAATSAALKTNTSDAFMFVAASSDEHGSGGTGARKTAARRGGR